MITTGNNYEMNLHPPLNNRFVTDSGCGSEKYTIFQGNKETTIPVKPTTTLKRMLAFRITHNHYLLVTPTSQCNINETPPGFNYQIETYILLPIFIDLNTVAEWQLIIVKGLLFVCTLCVNVSVIESGPRCSEFVKMKLRFMLIFDQRLSLIL